MARAALLDVYPSSPKKNRMADLTQQMPMLQVAHLCDRPTDDGADVTLWIRRGSELEVSPSKFENLPRPENSVYPIRCVEEAIKWMRIPERYDQLEDDGGDTILPIPRCTEKHLRNKRLHISKR